MKYFALKNHYVLNLHNNKHFMKPIEIPLRLTAKAHSYGSLSSLWGTTYLQRPSWCCLSGMKRQIGESWTWPYIYTCHTSKTRPPKVRCIGQGASGWRGFGKKLEGFMKYECVLELKSLVLSTPSVKCVL